MSKQIGCCTIASNGIGRGERVEVGGIGVFSVGYLVLNEAEARRVLTDLGKAIEHAWPRETHDDEETLP